MALQDELHQVKRPTRSRRPLWDGFWGLFERVDRRCGQTPWDEALVDKPPDAKRTLFIHRSRFWGSNAEPSKALALALRTSDFKVSHLGHEF